MDKKSVEWCRAAVDKCWSTKSTAIRKEEQEAARAAYDHARRAYDAMMK
jgi:hypothetical protein